MAVMNELPDRATIVAMRGRVDFYYWKGIPVARAWPRKSTQPRTAGEQASSTVFAYWVRATGGVSEQLRQAYKDMMHDTVGVTWVDGFRTLAMGGTTWYEY